MADLSVSEKSAIELLFAEDGKRVLFLRHHEFGLLVGDSSGIDINSNKYSDDFNTDCKILMKIIKLEDNFAVGHMLKTLLEAYRECFESDSLLENNSKKIKVVESAYERLLGRNTSVNLPDKNQETLQVLLQDINNSLLREQPELVLDRLHTYSTKLLRQICNKNGVCVTDERGNYYPIHSLAGMLKKHYIEEKVFESDFPAIALQNTIQMFEKFNEIRNEKSYAHDNPILSKLEAEFVVQIMANVIKFLNDVEEFNLPF